MVWPLPQSHEFWCRQQVSLCVSCKTANDFLTQVKLFFCIIPKAASDGGGKNMHDTFADPESSLLSSHKPWGFSAAELWKKSWHLGQIQWLALSSISTFPKSHFTSTHPPHQRFLPWSYSLLLAQTAETHQKMAREGKKKERKKYILAISGWSLIQTYENAHVLKLHFT